MGRVFSPIFFACAVAIGGPVWAQNLISNGEFASNVAGWDPWSSWASVEWNPSGATAAGTARAAAPPQASFASKQMSGRNRLPVGALIGRSCASNQPRWYRIMP